MVLRSKGSVYSTYLYYTVYDVIYIRTYAHIFGGTYLCRNVYSYIVHLLIVLLLLLL